VRDKFREAGLDRVASEWSDPLEVDAQSNSKASVPLSTRSATPPTSRRASK